MPFQPLPDNAPPKPELSDAGLLVVRATAVLAFLYYQLAGMLDAARSYIWERTEWDLGDRFAELGLPFPGPIAVAFTVVVAAALAGILVGIFTRINALILLVASAAILFLPLELSPSLTPQASLLYLGVFFGLALGGAGRLSLDYRLAGRKARKRGAA